MNNFKEDDWVRELDPLPDNAAIYQLTRSDLYGISKKSSKYFEDIEHWQPKQGEWCWISIANGFEEAQTALGKVIEIKPITLLGRYGQHVEELAIIVQVVDDLYPVQLNACQPFIGNLPTF